MDSYIDYIILSHYGDNRDWPRRNFYVGAKNGPDSTGFKFFSWDAELSMMLHTGSVDGQNFDISRFGGGIQALFVDLRHSAEFRMLFADHVHALYFNGGALYVDAKHPDWDSDNPDRNVPAARYVQVTNEIYEALLAESARWGDQHRPDLPFTRDREWVAERANLLQNWFPQRSEIMVNAYRQMELYPDVEAPRFNQHGGAVEPGFQLTFDNPNGRGTIYYTLDGSDPRLIGGNVSPTALVHDGNAILLSSSVPLKSRVFSDGEWSALNGANFTIEVGGTKAFAAGDANQDQQFDQFDVVQVLQSAKYRTGDTASWEEGDWNADGVFDQLDVVAALQTGNYLSGPNAANSLQKSIAADYPLLRIGASSRSVLVEEFMDSLPSLSLDS